MPNNKWAQYEEKPATANKWEQYAEPATPAAVVAKPSFLQGIQSSFDANTRTYPSEPLLQTGLKSLVGAIGSPFIHPVKTAGGLLDMIPDSPDVPMAPTHSNPIVDRGIQAYTDAKDGGLGYSATKLAGETLGGVALGDAIKLAPGAAGGVGDIGTFLRNAAIGDPNVAALKGLRVGPASKQALRTISAVEGARPFLQGASGLSDLQAKIPAAKSEIWSPYAQAIEKVGDTETRLGKIKDLEDRRLELSGQLRLVKSRNPGDIALAAQQGLDKAALLAEEKQIHSVLDPVLRDAGINPSAIRRSYADVGRIGSTIEGKSTLAENPKGYGLGRIMDINLHRPKSILGVIPDAARDIVAGRPIWSGSPTDVSLREAFRPGGTKPNFRTTPFTPTPPEIAGLLEANNIMEPGGEDYSVGNIPNRPNIVPPAPQSFPRLPASASAGDALPMIGVRATPPPAFAEDFARTRISPPVFASPEIIPPRGFVATPEGLRPANPLFLNAPKITKKALKNLVN